MKKLLLLFTCISISFTVQSQVQWALDSCFGDGGMVITDLNGNLDFGSFVLIQQDGKILGVGGTSDGSSAYSVIIRYNSDGSLDESFGLNGVVITPDSGAKAAALQNDQKIILSGGHGFQSFGNEALALRRYNSDGTLDESFGTNGLVTTVIGDYLHYGEGVIVQPDGKIVQSGNVKYGVDKVVLLRFETDGTPDATFGNNGRVVIDLQDSGDTYTLVCQSDGKLILGGELRNGSTYDFLMMRYLPNGIIDSTFGVNGVVLTDL